MQQQVAGGIAESSPPNDSIQAAARTRRGSGRGWSYILTSWLGLVPFSTILPAL